MTRNKDLKRLVRTRMLKTGEAYTAARAQILRKSEDSTANRARVAPRPATVRAAVVPEPKPVAKAAAPKPAEFARLAGMSDAVMKEKTGCTWDHWVKSLDYHGAAELSHSEIAAMVKTRWKVKPWWTQMIAVGYERIRGLRAKGQQRDGSYQAGKSRTFAVPVGELFDAWTDAATRKKWLTDITVKVRTATKPKSVRLGLEDGSIVAVGFMAKGKGKSAVAVEHTKLASREAGTRVKEEWSARFDALAEVLAAK